MTFPLIPISRPALASMLPKRQQSLLIMHRSVATLLFPEYRRRVLGLLFLGPDESLHGREIARRAGLPAGTLMRELRNLAEVGLLKAEKRGNQMLYSANHASPVFEEIKSILRKTSGLSEILADALTSLSQRIDVAFVFGSVARGTERAGSDIDVLIIGSVGLGTVLDVLVPAQQKLGRDINPKLFSRREWKARLAGGDPFAQDVMSKPKVFIVGGKDELEELDRGKPRGDRTGAGNRAAPSRRRR